MFVIGLTGKTGAGKSILIDSINAVTGEKTSRELIRTGEESAVVLAFFENISENGKYGKFIDKLMLCVI